eukprot:gnl/TRDRNA2_/TRDRNA2_138473_c0_seq1.p1 gnl/TRDRNA2_/TRDRNA2_138473_c0~~gnl/TRDRNA2_/TRDRNA2_138473_c0_seq1.p1  ORF type:complete len:332 (+),score=35.63 gnl/TRDRNA2_/TRDRNA2_138473_c0_seq1:60-998(+)
MTRLRDFNMEQSKQQEYVRQYLVDMRVSLELGNRINGFLRKHRSLAKQSLLESDITAFQVLPEMMRRDLHTEVYMPIITPHPFFFQLKNSDVHGFMNLCHLAMSQHSCETGHEVFASSKPATKMYFVISGTFEYYSWRIGRAPAPVQTDDCICEAALWLQWEYQGRLVSETHSRLVLVDSTSFRSVVSQAVSLGNCRKYARLYKEKLGQASETENGMSDIWVDFDSTQEIAQIAFDASQDTDGPGVSRSSDIEGSTSSWTTAVEKGKHLMRRFQVRFKRNMSVHSAATQDTANSLWKRGGHGPVLSSLNVRH